MLNLGRREAKVCKN